MADSDYSIIKPVESLQNVTGLTPAKRREERKQRRNLHQEEEHKAEQAVDESGDELVADEDDRHSIDYCA
ncbi:MAG: hypothetical protein ACYTEL_05925 [Planctomycetota bacterium]|jgi:hypothetical protein